MTENDENNTNITINVYNNYNNRSNRIESNENTNPNIDINSLYHIPHINNFPPPPPLPPPHSSSLPPPPPPPWVPLPQFIRTPESRPPTPISPSLATTHYIIADRSRYNPQDQRHRRRLLRRNISSEPNIIPPTNNFEHVSHNYDDRTRIREIECSVKENAKLHVTNECSICISPLNKLGSVTTPCGHQFCLGCFMTHTENMLAERGSSNCPLCRSDILKYK